MGFELGGGMRNLGALHLMNFSNKLKFCDSKPV